MAGKNLKRDLQQALVFEQKTRAEAKAVVAELTRASKHLDRARKAAGKARAPRPDPGLASWLTSSLRGRPPVLGASSRLQAIAEKASGGYRNVIGGGTPERVRVPKPAKAGKTIYTRRLKSGVEVAAKPPHSGREPYPIQYSSEKVAAKAAAKLGPGWKVKSIAAYGGRYFYYLERGPGASLTALPEPKKAPKAKSSGAAPKHALKVGQWLYSTWGYEQTNASFFKVVGVTPSGVVLQQYETNDTWTNDKHGHNTMVGTAVPGTKPQGAPKRKQVVQVVTSHGVVDEVKVGDSMGHAEPWDGRPVRVTSYG